MKIMGVKNLSALLKERDLSLEINYKVLDGWKVGFDAFNQLYQFLSTIRDPEGNSLRDEEGNTTSHLVGIIFRACNMLQNNISPVYVFDGTSHELKSEEQKKRSEAKDLARRAYDQAVEKGDMEMARMYARRINDLTPEMVDDAKGLLEVMGIPLVQAPGEGEAQSSYLTRTGVLHGTASQDYDTLMFGSPVLIRNLSSPRTRRTQGGTKTIYPEMYRLNEVLEALEISYEQLIDLGILMGTDFNEGFEKVGPKTAYRYITKYGSFEATRDAEEKIKTSEIDYKTIRDIFLNPDVDKSVHVNFDQDFNLEEIYSFLKDRNFELTRYKPTLEKTAREIEVRKSQTTIDDWF